MMKIKEGRKDRTKERRKGGKKKGRKEERKESRREGLKHIWWTFCSKKIKSGDNINYFFKYFEMYGIVTYKIVGTENYNWHNNTRNFPIIILIFILYFVFFLFFFHSIFWIVTTFRIRKSYRKIIINIKNIRYLLWIR